MADGLVGPVKPGNVGGGKGPEGGPGLNQKIYRHIEAWRSREIVGELPYLYLDGLVLKRSRAGEVRNISVLVATGICALTLLEHGTFFLLDLSQAVFGGLSVLTPASGATCPTPMQPRRSRAPDSTGCCSTPSTRPATRARC